MKEGEKGKEGRKGKGREGGKGGEGREGWLCSCKNSLKYTLSKSSIVSV